MAVPVTRAGHHRELRTACGAIGKTVRELGLVEAGYVWFNIRLKRGVDTRLGSVCPMPDCSRAQPKRSQDPFR